MGTPLLPHLFFLTPPRNRGSLRNYGSRKPLLRNPGLSRSPQKRDAIAIYSGCSIFRAEAEDPGKERRWKEKTSGRNEQIAEVAWATFG